jgi:hypothetical protein
MSSAQLAPPPEPLVVPPLVALVLVTALVLVVDVALAVALVEAALDVSALLPPAPPLPPALAVLEEEVVAALPPAPVAVVPVSGELLHAARTSVQTRARAKARGRREIIARGVLLRGRGVNWPRIDATVSPTEGRRAVTRAAESTRSPPVASTRAFS